MLATKCPAIHFNPPQALFICGLLLFVFVKLFIPPWSSEKTKMYFKDKKKKNVAMIQVLKIGAAA